MAYSGIKNVFLAININLNTLNFVAATRLGCVDVTGTVQLQLDVRTVNQKLGLIKDSSNIHVLTTSFSPSTSSFPTDVILTSSDFSNTITTDVLTVGHYSTLYSYFATCVQTYFGTPGGFASLYQGMIDFQINQSIFDASAFISTNVLSASNLNGAGYLDVSYTNQMLVTAVLTNSFGNRDTINGITADDWHNPSNYGINDGFIAGDLIYTSQGTAINLILPIAKNIYSSNTNIGPNNISKSIKNVIGDYSVSTIATQTQLSQCVSVPLLLVLVNTLPNNGIFVDIPIIKLNCYTSSLNMTWINYNYLFQYTTWNMGTNNSGAIYGNTLTTTIPLYMGYSTTFHTTPLNGTGSGQVGYTISYNYKIPPTITAFNVVSTATNGQSLLSQAILNWDGIYSSVHIISNGNVLKTIAAIDSSFHIGVITCIENLVPYTVYNFYLNPIDSSINTANIAGNTSVITITTPPCCGNITFTNVETTFMQLNWSGYYYIGQLYQNNIFLTNVSGGVSGGLPPPQYTYSINGLIPYTTYSYYIVPFDEFGISYSSSSRIISQRTNPGFTSLYLDNVTANSITINWKGYYTTANLMVFGNAIIGNLTLIETSTTPMDISFTYSGLQPFTNYSFYMIPFDDNSSNSQSHVYPISSIVTVQTWPQITSFYISSITNSSIEFTYSGLFASALVSQSQSQNQIVTTSIMVSHNGTYTENNLIYGTNYTFYMTPFDSSGIAYPSSPTISVFMDPDLVVLLEAAAAQSVQNDIIMKAEQAAATATAVSNTNAMAALTAAANANTISNSAIASVAAISAAAAATAAAMAVDVQNAVVIAAVQAAADVVVAAKTEAANQLRIALLASTDAADAAAAVVRAATIAPQVAAMAAAAAVAVSLVTSQTIADAQKVVLITSAASAAAAIISSTASAKAAASAADEVVIKAASVALHTAGLPVQCAAISAVVVLLFNSSTISNQFTSSRFDGITFTPGIHYQTLYTPVVLPAFASVTFDAQGNPDATFVIQLSTAVTTGASFKVFLINSAAARNIYWCFEAAVTIGATCIWNGNMILYQALTIGAGLICNGTMITLAASTVGANATINSIVSSDIVTRTCLQILLKSLYAQ